MQVSSAAREVPKSSVRDTISALLAEEVKLYSKIEYFMTLKGKIGERLMKIEPNEANIKKCLAQSALLDMELRPLSDRHQKVIDALKVHGVAVSRK
jgi:hypothetical protein